MRSPHYTRGPKGWVENSPSSRVHTACEDTGCICGDTLHMQCMHSYMPLSLGSRASARRMGDAQGLGPSSFSATRPTRPGVFLLARSGN